MTWWVVHNIVLISETHVQQVLLFIVFLLVITRRADEPVVCYGHGCPLDPVLALFVCKHATWSKALEYLSDSLSEPVVGD